VHNPYRRAADAFERSFREAAALPLGGFDDTSRRSCNDARRVLIFSPHPDDECIIGGLPLRLLREEQFTVINVAVTQGSNVERQAERWEELIGACRFLGFESIQTRKNGLERISPSGKLESPDQWKTSVTAISQILREQEPAIVFFPHAEDWNTTHIGVHLLLMDALSCMSSSFSCTIVETEFWGAMNNPNVMIESSVEDAADLMAATSFHVKEVQRNPYHTRLPAWMMDNVRRGGELVTGQGGVAPNFTFATLYRLRAWRGGEMHDVLGQGTVVSTSDRISSVLPVLL